MKQLGKTKKIESRQYRDDDEVDLEKGVDNSFHT